MNGKLNILLVEDNPGDARLIREALISARGTPFHLQVMDRLALGLECLAAGGIDLLLLDLSLPDCQGLETFTAAHTQAPGVPIIVLTGLDDETVAMAAMREGAQDYLVKGQADGDLLARSIHYAIERKRTEKALRDSETRYRRLFEAARDGILLLDAATGQITDVNPFMVELLGYSHQEYLGKRLWEIGLFKDIVASQAAFDELQREGYVRYEDLPLETRDGRPMSVEFVSNVYLVDSTRVIQCNIRDITERKQMEAALRVLSNRQEALLAAIPDIIMEVNNDKVYTWANQAGLEFFGEDALGHEAAFYFEGEQAVYAVVQPLFQSAENAIYVESWQRRKDGQKRLLAWWCRVLEDGRGNVTGALSSARDITERVQMEEALRASEERYRLISTVASDYVFSTRVEADGRLTLDWVAGAFEAITGYTFEEYVARGGWRVALHPDDLAVDDRDLEKLRANQPVITEVRTMAKSGQTVWVRVYAQPVWGVERNALVGIYGAVQDITERKRAEETIRRRNLELTALNQVGRALNTIALVAQPSEILELIFAAIGQVFDNRNLYVAFYDEASQFITFPLYAINGEKLARSGRPFGNGLTEYVIRTNAPLLIADHQTEFLAEHGVDSIGILSKCYLAAPMRVGERVIGVIAVQDYESENVYDAHHIELLDTLAAQAAIALENARLFGETLRLQEFNQSIVQNMGEGIAIEDVDGKLTFVNPAVAAMLGYAPEELLGQHWTLVIPPDQQPMVQAADERRKRGEADHYELELARKDGQRLPVLVSGSPRFEGDRFAGTMAVFTDITERKRAEQETRRLLDEAERSRHILLGLVEDQKRAEADIQRHVRRLSTLREIDHALTSTLDLDQVLSTLLEQARDTADAETASIALVEEGTGDLVFRQAAGDAGPFVVGLRLSPGQGVAGWAVEHRQVALVLDAASDPRFWGSVSRGTGFVTRDVMAAPLIAHDAVTGVIELVNKRSGVFDQDDAQWLESVAAQAAVAIENARLFEREREQRQRLETLYRVGQVVNLTLDAGAILDRLTDEAMRATHAAHGSALIVRPDLNCFERLSLRGYSPELAEKARSTHLPLDHGLNGRAYRTGQAVYLADVRDDPDYFSLIPETQSEFVVPLIRGGQIIGNLDLQSPEVDGFRDVDMDFMRALLDQVAVALENARLFEATRRRLDEMAIVSQVALTGAAGRPFDEAVTRAVDGMCRLWPDSRVSFLFLDVASQTLLLHPASRGVPPELIANFRVPLDQGLTGWAARERQPLRVGDVTQDSRYLAGLPGTSAEMAAPLVVGERAIGVINVECSVPDAYSGDDLRVLTALASQLATIFEKSRLDAEVAAYTATLEQRVQDRTAELQTANDQLREAHEQVRRALEQERELGDLKSRFISMTSHEFRTPLTTILSSTEMLEHYGPRWTEEKRLTHLHRIKTSVQNMTRLLEDVLILGRAEAGRLEFNPEPLDLVQFCRDLIEEIQLSVGPRYTLELACEADRAPAYMDEKLLRQILTNLLSNAVKYSPGGGVVHLSLTCYEGRAVFQVRDHGIGIPDEAQARLFETFHRAKNVGTIPGTGLGLAIVKKSVDLHGGTIAFASGIGQGTTFTVTLPTAAQPEQPNEVR